MNFIDVIFQQNHNCDMGNFFCNKLGGYDVEDIGFDPGQVYRMSPV